MKTLTLPWKLQSPTIALKGFHDRAREKNLPALSSVDLAAPCLWEALALTRYIYLVSFCVHFSPGPMVSLAAIYKDIITEMYTGAGHSVWKI